LEIIASPLKDKEGLFLGTLLILRDKTELNLLKSEMEQNKRLAVIGRLAAGVAHSPGVLFDEYLSVADVD